MKTIRDVPVLSGGSRLGGHAECFRSDRLGLFQQLHREHRDIATFRVFQQPVVWLNSPALIHELLVENVRSFDKSSGARFAYYPLTGEGLLTSNGHLWRKQRRTMAPFFASSYVGEYLECARSVILRWASELRDGQQIDVTREMTRIAMTIVGKALFDADMYEAADELSEAVTTYLELTSEVSGSFGVMVKMVLFATIDDLQGRIPPAWERTRGEVLKRLTLPSPLPTERARRLRHALSVLGDCVTRMIAERRAAGLTRNDLLTRLLLARDEDGSAMTDEQVRNEVLTLFFAGHETTAMSMAWTLYLLACNPEARERQRAEVGKLGGALPGMDDLAELPYTQATFKEALRLYPAAYIFDRVARTDVTLGGYAFRKGTVFFVSPYTLHRRPDFWPDPDRFDPQRFLPEAEAKRPRFTYLAFGAGPRVCVGNSLAQLEGQLLLTLLAQRVTFSFVPGQSVVPVPATTLRAPQPLYLRVHALDRHAQAEQSASGRVHTGASPAVCPFTGSPSDG